MIAKIMLLEFVYIFVHLKVTFVISWAARMGGERAREGGDRHAKLLTLDPECSFGVLLKGVFFTRNFHTSRPSAR